MNPLIETILDKNPDYPIPLQIGEKNRIYVMQFPAYIRGAEAGYYPYSFFIGQTDPARGWVTQGEYLVRWDDNDYSKCPEKPKLLTYIDVHPDLSDHDIRSLMRKYGWVKYLSDYPEYGAHEMIMHPNIKDWNVGIRQVLVEVKKEDEYYREFERKFKKSPSRRKSKDRKDEMYRIPDRELLMDMCDDILKHIKKDDKIYVVKDAHGQICDYFISKGYTNLYTEKSYKYFPKGEIAISSGLDVVTLLTDNQIEKMKNDFDVTIGNPPFQDSKNNDIASNLWSKSWVKAIEVTKDDGIVSLITPSSWCSPSQDFKKKADTYEGDRRLWDTFNRFTSVADVENVAQYFNGVGSTFSRVTVYKSGNEGLSFTNPESNVYLKLGFHPMSGNPTEIFPFFDMENNLKKYFKMDEEGRPGLKVSVPKTKLFDKPGQEERVQILKSKEVGTAGSSDPRNYFYIYVDDEEQARVVKNVILDAKDIICKHCRWAGFLNLKVVEYLKYVPEKNVLFQE
jgi:hypothetical protein